jgi:cholesterol oxidase
MARLGEAIGAGTLVENPFSLLSRHVTVHPLGGCPMGASPEDGVVDARTGQAFGHPGLYVIDGSIVPGAIGPNPALTIAALAEYYAEAFR